jgi:hypothetical protein
MSEPFTGYVVDLRNSYPRPKCVTVDNLFRALIGAGPMSKLHQLDIVALTVDVSEHGLVRGQVGTIVATLASNMYEIEFSDEDGRTYAELALKGDQLMLLHYRRERAA